MDEHTIKCNIETRRNKEKVNNIKPIVPANPQIKTRNIPSRVANSVMERNSMALGTTTDSLTPEINHFLYARETKYLTLKDLDSYLIPDG